MAQLEYKGYVAEISYSHEDLCLYGVVHSDKALIMFDDDMENIDKAFQTAIDEYLEDCEELRQED